jgi:hypothetical protein
MCSQSPCKMPKSEISIINTICFERSGIIHLGGFGLPFGFLWDHFSCFLQKVAIRDSKKHTKDNIEQWWKKVTRVGWAIGVWALKELKLRSWRSQVTPQNRKLTRFLNLPTILKGIKQEFIGPVTLPCLKAQWVDTEGTLAHFLQIRRSGYKYIIYTCILIYHTYIYTRIYNRFPCNLLLKYFSLSLSLSLYIYIYIYHHHLVRHPLGYRLCRRPLAGDEESKRSSGSGHEHAGCGGGGSYIYIYIYVNNTSAALLQGIFFI